MGRPQGSISVSAEDFIRAYMKNNCNVIDTANTLGLSPVSVYARLDRYTKMGVNLPKSTRKSRKLNIDPLNDLVEILIEEGK